MSDIPRGKYEILDLIFTILIAICMVTTSIFLLSTLIISLIHIIVVILFAFVAIFLWKSQNPFTIYLVRAFAINNVSVTFIALLIFFYDFNSATTEYPGYILLLVPAGIYLLISIRSSAFPLLSKKGVGMLFFAGYNKSAMRLLIRDNPKEAKKREELITRQKKKYRLNLIIALIIIFTLYNFITIFFGFS